MATTAAPPATAQADDAHVVRRRSMLSELASTVKKVAPVEITKSSSTGDYENYGTLEYWDSRYERGEAAGFEWLGDWDDVKASVTRDWAPNSNVLHIGCGDSDLGLRLAEAGHSVLNTDLSGAVVDRMKQQYPEHRFAVADCLALDEAWKKKAAAGDGAGAGGFDVVLDKGTFDALQCIDGKAKKREAGETMLRECFAVLRPGGRLVLVALRSPEIMRPFIDQAGDWASVRHDKVLCHGKSSKTSWKVSSLTCHVYHCVK